MSDKKRKERLRLLRLWALGKATKSQMLRCMTLDRSALKEKS